MEKQLSVPVLNVENKAKTYELLFYGQGNDGIRIEMNQRE